MGNRLALPAKPPPSMQRSSVRRVTFFGASKRMRVNYRQPRNIFEIARVSGNQLESMNERGGCDDGIGQFDFVLISQGNSLIYNWFGKFQNVGIIHEIGQQLVSGGGAL